MNKEIVLSLTDAQAIQDLFECNQFPHYRTPAMQRAIANFYQAIEEKEAEYEKKLKEMKNEKRTNWERRSL